MTIWALELGEGKYRHTRHRTPTHTVRPICCYLTVTYEVAAYLSTCVAHISCVNCSCLMSFKAIRGDDRKHDHIDHIDRKQKQKLYCISNALDVGLHRPTLQLQFEKVVEQTRQIHDKNNFFMIYCLEIGPRLESRNFRLIHM